MHRLSMVQALSLWSDFEDALRREAAYGADVAEIYVYRLMARDPQIESYRAAKNPSALGRSEYREAVEHANESFYNLLAHFAETRNAAVEIAVFVGGTWTWKDLGLWLREHGEDHRWHVRIRPRAATK